MKEDQDNQQFKIVLKWLGYSVLLFFLLSLLLTLLIQVPVVQNWVVRDLSERISKDLDTEVRVGNVRLNFFDDLLIGDLLIRDRQQDTLFYCQRAYINADKPLLGLINGKISIQSVELKSAQCFLKTNYDQSSNYDFIVQYLKGDGGGNSTSEEKGIRVILDPVDILLNDITFYHENKSSGQNSTLQIPNGQVELRKVDEKDPLHFERIIIDQPNYVLEKYPTDSPVAETGREIEIEDTAVSAGSFFALLVDNLQVNGGSARVINRHKPKGNLPSNVIDWTDVKAREIDLLIQNFSWQDGQGNLDLDLMTFAMPEGFEVKNLRCQDVSITGRSLTLNDYVLETANTRLSNQIKFKFKNQSDFNDFENKVEIEADFRNSHVAMKDILYFSEKLNENEFFNLNGGKRIDISGTITGTINDLRGRRIDLQLADKGFLQGDFHLKNATLKGDEQLKLELQTAQIALSTLRQLIPNFNPPENYDKLGLLQFTGNFDGLFRDFVASGDLLTDLGRMNMDMRMNWDSLGFKNASYQGKLELLDFDLATWSGSEDFGITTFSAEVRDGKGLSIDDAYANLYAKLDDFYYKGYRYKDAALQGELNNRFFDGQFYISDPNVTLDFNGHIDITDTLPKFDFTASVEYLNFQAINLTERKLEISGDIDFDFTYHDIFNLDGSVRGHDLQIVDDTVRHVIDSIRINSQLNHGYDKNLQVVSDIFDFHLIGDFDLQRLPSTIRRLIQAKHPQLAKKLKLSHEIGDSLYANQDFHFNGTLVDSRGVQKLFNSKLDDFRQVVLNGSFSNDSLFNFKYRMDVHAPFVRVGRNQAENIALDLVGENKRSQWDIYSEKVTLGVKELTPVSFHGVLASDSLEFSLNSNSFADIFTDIDLTGLLYLNDTLFQVDLANSSFYLLNELWQVIPRNYIQLGDHFLKTRNMVFLSDDSYIRVSSPGDNSLIVETEKVDISFLDDLQAKKKLHFDGYAYSLIHFDNIFEKSPVLLDITVDSLRINDDDYGTFNLTYTLPDLESEGIVDLLVSDGRKEFELKGDFYYPIKGSSGGPVSYDLRCSLQEYPLIIGEYFIGHSISNTSGTINGDFRLFDEEGRASIDGEVVLNGSTRIDYLGTSYRMDHQTIAMSSNLFDLSGAVIVDELGNRATFSGGLPHDHFKKIGMDATISSDYFQFLKTTKEDNNIYYGTALGKAEVQFSGDFQRAIMRIRATTGPGTKLFIPVEDNISNEGGAFLTFAFEQDSNLYAQKSVNLTGVNLDMQLNITPDAEMQLIFDEFSGDIIKGTGSGSLTMTKERVGNLQMTGKYVIDQGQYLYTLLDFINKPFAIDRGGLITWNGDPLNADLNIQARYTGLKVPPRNLISEYLEGRAGGTVGDAADISTQVDLILALRGILSQPQIDFDLRFPDIDPSLRNYTESKLRILKEDVSELNRQVYGLLFFNSFLPSTVSVDIAATTVNTLSEFITSQLSNYVAAYITEGVEEVDYISGVDFYFDYNYYRSEDFLQGQQTGVKTGSEFSLAPNIRFFEDRLAFSPGVSVIEGTVLQGSAFIGSDVRLDYFVTRDRRLRLSLFYKRFPSLQGSRDKVGVGFRFSKSYDSIGDIFRRQREKKPTADSTSLDPPVDSIIPVIN